jgi:anti-anti-sigma regulatory factor
MKFIITEKNSSLYVKICKLKSASTHTFFPLVDSLMKEIKDAYNRKNLPVVFDLLDIKFIDSYLISILAQSTLVSKPRKNSILVSDKKIMDLLVFIGINKAFDIFESYEEWAGKN